MTPLTEQPMTLNLDQDGYLVELSDWNPAIAEQLAQTQNITLTPAHWEVIDALRDFYQQFEIAPSQRPFVKHMANTLGSEKGFTETD